LNLQVTTDFQKILSQSQTNCLKESKVDCRGLHGSSASLLNLQNLVYEEDRRKAIK